MGREKPQPAGDEPAFVAAMSDPDFYPHRPEEVSRRETHASWLFLAGDRVYKVKKPVSFPFLDYGTRERRRELCEEEVRLNRRLTSDVYLGVRSIVERDGGLSLDGGTAEDAVEWAVEMRRLPEERTLQSLRRSGAIAPDHIRAVAERIARFHAAAAPAPEGRGGPEAVKRAVDDNFASLLGFPELAPDRRRLLAAERFADAFMSSRRDELEERVSRGRIRDCHGDLRLEHVVLEDGVQVFDCVEFDPSLREIDVAADLAYLVMELASNGSAELADELVREYRRAGGEPGGDALLSFYAAYRALVRAKVALLRARQQPAAEEEGLASARGCFATEEHYRWRARLPLVLVVCGVTASGKTALAERLGERAPLTHVASDPVRKELLGLAPTERAPERAYGDAASRATYAELGRRAAAIADRGAGVVVDATFRRTEHRRAFREGLGAVTAPVLFCECRAAASVLRRRAEERLSDAARASDAAPELVERQLREFEPLDEVPAGAHVTVRSDRQPDEVLDELEALLDRAASSGGS